MRCGTEKCICCERRTVCDGQVKWDSDQYFVVRGGGSVGGQVLLGSENYISVKENCVLDARPGGQ